MIMPSQEQLSKTGQQSMDDMQGYARDMWDLALKSASAMSKGWDETMRNAQTMVQESFNRAVSASKTIAGAKSPKEMMDLHAEYMKESFDHFIAGTGKISEISARTTKETIDPVAQHTNAALSKMWSKASAASAA